MSIILPLVRAARGALLEAGSFTTAGRSPDFHNLKTAVDVGSEKPSARRECSAQVGLTAEITGGKVFTQRSTALVSENLPQIPQSGPQNCHCLRGECLKDGSSEITMFRVCQLSDLLPIAGQAATFAAKNRSKLMMRNVALSAVAGGLMSLAAALATAQDSAVLSDLYGRGVHAYFSHDNFKAVELFNEAISNGSADPRAYYFRGLALRALGREDDAALDFKQGAKLEQGAVEWINVVSKSLERVQGATRMEIEAQRRVARLQTRNDRLAREKQRYEDITKDDERVLRKPEPAKPTPRPPAVLPETAPPEAGDPFGDEPAAKPATPAKPVPPADPVEETPAVTPEPAEETPEPPPAKPAAPKPAADPFSDEPLEAPEAPAAEPPAVEPTVEPEPEAAAAVKPAAKPGKAGRSLFGALSKAFIGDAAVKETSRIDVSNAKDPFADEEVSAPVDPVPAPPKKAAPAEVEVEDPFK